jgi:hypothetical protein
MTKNEKPKKSVWSTIEDSLRLIGLGALVIFAVLYMAFCGFGQEYVIVERTSTPRPSPTSPTPTSAPTIEPTSAKPSRQTAEAMVSQAKTATARFALPEDCPDGCVRRPPGCDIKGNISFDSGEKIYHTRNRPGWHTARRLACLGGKRGAEKLLSAIRCGRQWLGCIWRRGCCRLLTVAQREYPPAHQAYG